MQYRLGAHGFIFMGANSSAPGNAGLLDQVMEDYEILWSQLNWTNARKIHLDATIEL